MFKFPVQPVTVEGVHFKRAVYQCRTCGALTLRADAVQNWGTVITVINQEEFEALKEERKQYMNNLERV